MAAPAVVVKLVVKLVVKVKVLLPVLLPVVRAEGADDKPLLVIVPVVLAEPEADAEEPEAEADAEPEAEPDAVGLVGESIANWPVKLMILGDGSDWISSA